MRCNKGRHVSIIQHEILLLCMPGLTGSANLLTHNDLQSPLDLKYGPFFLACTFFRPLVSPF